MPVVNIAPMTDADLDEVSSLLRICFNWLADREKYCSLLIPTVEGMTIAIKR